MKSATACERLFKRATTAGDHDRAQQGLIREVHEVLENPLS
jgi:hypothetical protein